MNCPPERIVYDPERGEYVCTLTGEVIEEEEVIVSKPEWRAFTQEERERRVRATVAPDMGSTLSLAEAKQDGKEKLFWRHNAVTWRFKARTETKAWEWERELLQELGLPLTLQREVHHFVYEARRRGLVQSRDIGVVVAGTIYLVARMRGIPVTLDRLAKAAGFTRKEIGKFFRLLVRELGIRLPLPDPRLYLPWLCSQLNLPPKVQKRALELLEEARRRDPSCFFSKNPVITAGAAVYLASGLEGERREQGKIAKLLDVSETGLRLRIHHLCRVLGLKGG